MFRKIVRNIKNSYVVRNYSNILPYIKPYWFRALLAVFVTIPVGALDAAIPWALKHYIDSMTSGIISPLTRVMPFLIIGFAIFQSSFTYLSTYMNVWVGTKISNDLKKDLFKKLIRCDASFFDQNVSGTIQVRFNSDVDTACTGLLRHFKMFSTRIFNSLALITALIIISWQLAIIALIVLLIALAPLTQIRKRIANLVSLSVTSSGSIASQYIETFSGNRVVSSFNLYGFRLRKFLSTLDTAFKIGMKMTQRTGILSPMMHLIIGCGIAVIIWSGSYLISQNLLTTGGFVAFTTSVIMLYQPIKSLGDDLNSLQISVMAIERVFSLLTEEPKIKNSPNAVQLKSVEKLIRYKDVCFSYDSEKQILKNVNLEISAGQTVALVGNSGGGKTTLANLLPRFYDITGGEISIDGIDIRNIELDSLRDLIAIVFQDNFLFNGTIKENILLGNENATDEELNTAIKSACLSNFVASLKNGLNTQVGERGVLLSGGQKQRIAIARAFIKNAPIVILDEATSALDNKSEAIVQKAIDNLMKDRTVLIIAHRLSTIRNADKIVVVNYGEIAEQGTHDELIRDPKSIYYSLYNTQK